MSKQNLLTSQLSILLLGVVIGVFASIGFSYISKPSIHQVGTACTAEAKICPDGSTVGRVGPNCEFTPCSATISKPPGYFDTGCSIDDDCVLVDKESVDCCGNNGCQPVDYSQDKWIAANARWQAERISKNCLTNMACPNCLPRPINENFKAVCQNGACQKVPLPTDQNQTKQTCGGWDSSGETICECSGNITKSVCPSDAICDGGTYYCEGICGKCCYKGIAENVPYPKCL